MQLRVFPTVALWDRAREVVVSGLRPGERVILRARSPLEDGVWTSSATFSADARGVVDIAHQAPLSGSYTGVSAMGPLWSETLKELEPGPFVEAVRTELTVTISGRKVASATLTALTLLAGATKQHPRVGSTGFFGEYYAPAAGHRRAPAVVLWGGSDGGLGSTPRAAALLASHGIPALALAYFDEPGLPCRLQDIPLEYFVRAISWLRRRRQVDPTRVWILADSRGTEPALLVAAQFPGLVHGLIAAAPNAFVGGAAPGICQTAGATEVEPAWTLAGRALPQTAIPPHRISANVLLIAGGEDLVWPSNTYAARLMAALPRDRFAHRYLYYPRAGHDVFSIPYVPVSEDTLDGGGTIASDSAAYISDWPATIRFITDH